MPQCQAGCCASTSCMWRQTRTAPSMVQLVYNLCCALRKTLDVKSPRLVGEGPSNREVGGAHSAGQQAGCEHMELCHLWVDWGASKKCSLADGRRKVPCGGRLHFHGDHCPLPEPWQGSGYSPWNGDTPGSDMGTNSRNGICDQPVATGSSADGILARASV